MKTYTFRRQQTIARPIDDVFNFFKQPDNLEKITPSSVGFTILTPRPLKMQVGTVLDYTIKLFGLPVRWTTLISAYDPPHCFIDVATRGPYSFWHHTHMFEENDQGTIMTDEVHYALPFGIFGRLARFLWVKRQLEYIFDYRMRVICEVLKNGDAIGPEDMHLNSLQKCGQP
jgi:ligand-binding SRPBCC domain-containing protein